MQEKKRFWTYSAAVLMIVVLAEITLIRETHFTFDGLGFFAWYGFLSSLGLIVLAKLFALLLKRRDDYYTQSQEGGDD